MPSDTAKLQKAIFTLLAADVALTALTGGAKIYDRPMEGAALPYVTLGITRAFDASTASEIAHEHLFSTHAWSRKGGRKEALEILQAMRLSLENIAPVQDGMRIVALRFQSEDVTYNEQVAAYQGTLRLRILTEAETL
jgi:Protein of unknown function (DUF3168)